MKHTFVPLLAVTAMACLVVAGCGQAAPPPAPTKAPAVPTKAAEPTKASAPTKAPAPVAQPTAAPAAPTAAPAKKVDYPTKGKPVTIMVPYAAGGNVDLDARMLAPELERALGTVFEVSDKPGAGTQLGLTELVNAKPDGYYIGYTANPTTVITYLDPDRKATYSRKSFEPIALRYSALGTVNVKADSPYKTLKDLVDAAKAKPMTIKVGQLGQMTTNHFAWLLFEKTSGAKFASVFFDGSNPATTALLGGHVDVTSDGIGNVHSKVKNGDLRVLGIMDPQPSKFLPGVPTLESQGYKVNFSSLVGLSAPGGTPREIVNALSEAIKRANDMDSQKKKFDDLGSTPTYLNPEAYSKMWAEQEEIVKALMPEAKEQAK